jgi:probable HAF family extracellular repeat protein
VLLAVAAALACSDRSSPAAPPPPDSTSIDPANLVRRCTAAPNAIRIRHSVFIDSAGAWNGGTVYVGDTVRAYAPTFGYFISVLYGSATVVGPSAQYVAPTDCVGLDSAWFPGKMWNSTRALDTILYVFTVTEPKILAPDSATLVAGGSVTVDALAPQPRAAWTDPHIIGFLGKPHGTVGHASDSLLAYTAPSDFAGVDTVTMIAEATYKAAVIRDTTTVLVTVRTRTPPPTYTVTPIVGNESSAALTPRGLSTDGRVAGTVTFANGTTHAFSWTEGQFRDLGTYDSSRTESVGINASGAVAGFARLADSTYQGLVWYPDGSVATVPGGRPIPVGISNDGTVFTDDGSGYGYPKTIWRNGQVVAHPRGQPDRLTYGGTTAMCDWASFNHTNCYALYPSGTAIEQGRTVLALNDAGNAIVYENDFGYSYTGFIRSFVPGAESAWVPLSSVWAETSPPGYVTPPYADTLSVPEPLALTNDLSYLTQTLVLTPNGAYSINAQIADKSWHLVRAVTMNYAGQILAVGYNTVTGAKEPILLTPR